METKPPEKKGILRKIKENVDDHDEQMQILGTMVRRRSYLVWFYHYINYVELPMVKKTRHHRTSRLLLRSLQEP